MKNSTPRALMQFLLFPFFSKTLVPQSKPSNQNYPLSVAFRILPPRTCRLLSMGSRKKLRIRNFPKSDFVLFRITQQLEVFDGAIAPDSSGAFWGRFFDESQQTRN